MEGEKLTMSHTGCVDYEINNEMMNGTAKFGCFDKTPPDIAAKTGKENYDVEMCFWGGQMTVHAALTENDTKMLMTPMFDHTSKELEEFYWVSRKEVDELAEVIMLIRRNNF